MKKVLSILTAVFCLFSVMTAAQTGVFAAEDDYTDTQNTSEDFVVIERTVTVSDEQGEDDPGDHPDYTGARIMIRVFCQNLESIERVGHIGVTFRKFELLDSEGKSALVDGTTYAAKDFYKGTEASVDARYDGLLVKNEETGDLTFPAEAVEESALVHGIIAVVKPGTYTLRITLHVDSYDSEWEYFASDINENHIGLLRLNYYYQGKDNDEGKAILNNSSPETMIENYPGDVESDNYPDAVYLSLDELLAGTNGEGNKEPDVTTPAAENTASAVPTENTATAAPEKTTAPAAATTATAQAEADDAENSSNTVLYIIIAVIAVAVVIGIIVIMLKKKKIK